MPCLILYSSFHISCTCWASTSIYAPLKDTNWTSNKPLIGTNWTYRISTSFHGPFWMLSACTYLFHKLLPGANCICTTCNSLHGSSWDAKCTCETSTRLYEPLGDPNHEFRTSQAFTSQRAAKCSYQTFTSLHKPLHGSNCTCRILYEPLREANSTYQISNWFYNLFQGAKLHLKNH